MLRYELIRSLQERIVGVTTPLFEVVDEPENGCLFFVGERSHSFDQIFSGHHFHCMRK